MPPVVNTPKPQIQAAKFRKSMRYLILATWNIPPVVGLSFLIFINMFSPQQMLGILTTPVEPGFIIFWIVFSLWYFERYCRPISNYIEAPQAELAELAVNRIKRFPLHYWGLFLTYLVMAPASVIIAAEMFTDFVAQPVDWFRIHLVALIVSIIVGLPIFFLILDLFGKVMSDAPLSRPHVTIKMKVFLIGALIPLLIDTMLVQYFWTRTGYFTTETFIVWLVLEFLAIAGSLIFVRSFGHSLAPLESLMNQANGELDLEFESLSSQSTDEIGVLAKFYRGLLGDLKIQSEMLELNNSLLSEAGHGMDLPEITNTIIQLCGSALAADKVFLILHDNSTNELVGVAQTGETYREEGYYRLGLDETSMAVMVYKEARTFAISDVQHDPRCSPSMKQRFNVRSALAVPLLVESRPIGVLMSVSNNLLHDYSKREVLLMEGFAREAALAIHTHRLNMLRLEAESRGEEQRNLVNLLMRSTEEAIYGVDTDGICTFVNPSCVRMLGYSDENELIGQSIHELIHHTFPDGSPYPKEQCRVRVSTIDGLSGHSSEEVHWRKDGSSFPVEYWSHPIRKEGEVVGAVVSFIDITQRIEAERSRQESEQKYRALFESAGDSIFIMRNETLVDCNQRTLDLFGCTREQFIGKTASEFSPDLQPDGQQSQHKITQYLDKVAQGEPQFFEWLCQSNDDSLFSAEVGMSRISVGDEYLIQVILRDISERKQAEEIIRHMAFHDVLTGLVNRHEFENRMKNALESVKERAMQHALLYIDLDQFKVVNDTCGHTAGDELLKQLAELLHEPVRDRDTVARLGGDEFGVLLENCPIERAEEIANQIVKLVREFRFVWQDKMFSVGASIGIAILDDAKQTTGEILKTADMACYMSKELGRNRVHLFAKGDAELLQRQTEMGMVSHIHHALDNGHFTLYTQPIVDLNGSDETQSLSEIFVRMINNEGEVILPAAFIASAERYNLMPEIDRWVIHETFTHASSKVRKQNKSRKMVYFINLSGTSFNDDSFLAFVQEQLTREMLDPSQICFEVTETAAITNIARVQKFIKAIKKLGCRFALDDFGSGLSSYTYLKQLPVDYLKIDGSFVRDMLQDKKDYSIVESISQLGHSLGIKTIAEFVESEEIIRSLREVGVDYAQGYAIKRPQALL